MIANLFRTGRIVRTMTLRMIRSLLKTSLKVFIEHACMAMTMNAGDLDGEVRRRIDVSR
jgi:hypothetical protein